jgi:hypothetical protein
MSASRSRGVLQSLWGLLKPSPRGHRPYGSNEERLLRHVMRQHPNRAAVSHEKNPGALLWVISVTGHVANTRDPWVSYAGLRVEPEFVTVEEARAIAACAMDLVGMYGLCHVTDDHRAVYAKQMRHQEGTKEVSHMLLDDEAISHTGASRMLSKKGSNLASFALQAADLVNMARVTGRFEGSQEKLAPWKYGDDFDLSQVPEPLREVIKRIEACGSFCLGAPRDITINYRHSYFFR